MIKTLISLGYRKMNNNIYGKPVGMNLFTFELNILLWTNWFMGNNNTQLIWNSKTYKEDETVENDLLEFLKSIESNSRLSRTQSKYKFLTTTEILELL